MAAFFIDLVFLVHLPIQIIMMEFLNPYFLFAFGALAIPVLIHLFNLRRYRKEYFTNVRFLSNIQLETRKSSRLKQLLILVARLLAVSCLVLAFSQPFIPSHLQNNRKSGYRAVSIYIDNSYSMDATGTEGKLLDLARKRASEIVSAYKSSDIFQLVTNDFEGKHLPFLSREEFLGLLREVKITHNSVNLHEIIRRQNDIFARQNESNRIQYLISDFQKSTADFENLRPDSLTNYILVPVVSIKQNNLFVDSVWFATPAHRLGQAVNLKVRIKNCGSDKLEKIPLRLTVNNVQKSVTSFTTDPGQSTEISLPYTEDKNGFQLGRLDITDYPVVYDDMFYFTYNIAGSLNILSIYGKSANPCLQSLYASDSVFSFSSSQSDNVKYTSLSNQNLILISGMDELASGLASELTRFLEKGGSVCVFPPENPSKQSFNAFLTSVGAPVLGNQDTVKQRVASLDIENELFMDVFEKNASGKISLPDNVDLPVAQKYYLLSGGSSNQPSVLMRLQNGSPFLISSNVGKGKLYICASPLDRSFTNFQQHLLFVPVMFRMAFLSENQSSLYYIIGRNESIDLPSDTVSEKNMVKIKELNNTFEFIPEVRTSGQQMQVFVHSQVNEAGWYNVFRGSKPLTSLAFNYDRKESDINCLTFKEIESNIKKYNLRNLIVLKPSGLPFASQVERINMGFPLWKWFIILALVFFGAEIIIIRIFRT